MALTGLEIYKQLPKTNCKDCGFPTCLAFAMKMATKQVSLDKCPHVTAEGKAALESSARPPIQLVTICNGDTQIRIGNETQLYRHEEKFHRPAAVAVRISDTLDDDALAARAAACGKLSFERVGNQIRVNLVAVDNESGDAKLFAKAAGLAAEKSGMPCMLMSSKADNLKKAAEALAGQRSLLYISDPTQALAAAQVAKQAGCPLAVRADGLEAIAELTTQIAAAGVE
jgi:acetyl-CoA decarbonylase/synthase, CODH/ACS complex subunit gamma